MQNVEAGDLFETHLTPLFMSSSHTNACGVGNIYLNPTSLTSSMSNRHGAISHSAHPFTSYLNALHSRLHSIWPRSFSSVGWRINIIHVYLSGIAIG
jgi:hypothetical protein